MEKTRKSRRCFPKQNFFRIAPKQKIEKVRMNAKPAVIPQSIRKISVNITEKALIVNGRFILFIN